MRSAHRDQAVSADVALHEGRLYGISSIKTIGGNSTGFIALTTGDRPVVWHTLNVIPRLRGAAVDVVLHLYQGSDYSGGTPVNYWSLNKHRQKGSPLVNAVDAPTINDLGEEVFTQYVGEVETPQPTGLILAADTPYVLGIENDENQSIDLIYNSTLSAKTWRDE